MRFQLHVAVLPIALLTILGCGPADGRSALRGKVLIDGQPAAGAAISFRPVGHEGNTTGITVIDGTFDLDASKGLLPGRYSVALQAYRNTGRTFHDPQRDSKMPEYAPIEFKSIEPAEIEISVGKPNEFEIRAATGKNTGAP
jgi:hypothetical protein